MPRKPDLDRPTQLELSIPESWRTRLDLLLFSEVEGRVPLGRYREFFLERLRDYFDSRRLELAPFGFPEGAVVSGPKEVIDLLERKLKNG